MLQLTRRRGPGFYGTGTVTTANERVQTESYPDFWEREVTHEPSKEDFPTILRGHNPKSGYGGTVRQLNVNTFQRVPMPRTETWSYQISENDRDLYLQLVQYVGSLPLEQATITCAFLLEQFVLEPYQIVEPGILFLSSRIYID